MLINLDNAHVLCRRPSEYLIIADAKLQLMNLEMPHTVELPASSYTSTNGEILARATVTCPILFHGVLYLYGSLESGSVGDRKQYAIFRDNQVSSS